MIDNCNRNIDYIRISVTDRCNLRCIYCMPKEGIKALPHTNILTYDEILRLCRCFVRLGITKVKITGGEPLVRKNISGLIGQIKSLEGIKSVTLTTNGVLLKEQLPELMKAGLDGVNISLDTLDPYIYANITRKDEIDAVLASIQEALKYPRLKVKINCVPTQDTKKDDIINIASLARYQKLSIRFIEMMPIGLGKNFSYYGENNIKNLLEEVYGKFEVFNTIIGNGPAHYYRVPGFTGEVGFISALTHEFCNECNRVRLTSEGYLKTCLHYEKGTDLKTLLRGHEDDYILEQEIRKTIFDKPVSHNFKENNKNESYEKGHMSKIGG